jgi:hypothetical protein
VRGFRAQMNISLLVVLPDIDRGGLPKRRTVSRVTGELLFSRKSVVDSHRAR